jgi:CTP synthase (UTP-ammonia lyase)
VSASVPYFGICFGMQMAVIETLRNVAGMKGASSSEFGPTERPVVGIMTEWIKGNETVQRRANDDLGGTMRLGAYRRGPDNRARRSPTSTARPRSASATGIATRSISATPIFWRTPA